MEIEDLNYSVHFKTINFNSKRPLSTQKRDLQLKRTSVVYKLKLLMFP